MIGINFYRDICIRFLLILIVSVIIAIPLAARKTAKEDRKVGDFSDLFEEDHRAYGSERENKYPVKALVVEKEKWEGHESLHVLWLFKYTHYPRYNYTRVFPFYFDLRSKIDNRKRKIIFPFYYNRIDGMSERTVSWLWLNHKNEMEDFNLYFGLFLRWKHDTMQHTALMPFFFRGFDSANGNSYLGVFPLFYYESNIHNRRFNFIGLFDTTFDKHGLESIWFIPFIYFGRDSSIHRPGNSAFKEYSRHNKYYFHFFPFFLSAAHTHSNDRGGSVTYNRWIYAWLYYKRVWRDFCNPANFSKSMLLGPIWWSRRNTDSQSYSGSETSFHFFPLSFNWVAKFARKKEVASKIVCKTLEFEDTSSNLTLLNPLFYYKNTINKNNKGGIEEYGRYISWFQYYSWSPGKKRLWALLYYYSFNKTTGVKVRHLLPLYYSWRGSKSTGDIFFPFYLEYESKKTYFFTTLGFALRKTTGGIDTSVSVGRREGKYYLDWDISWLYNAFSISTRYTVDLNFKKGDKKREPTLEEIEKYKKTGIVDIDELDKTKPDIIDPEKKIPEKLPKNIEPGNKKKKSLSPALQKRKPGVTRDESEKFFGMHLLFGIFAMEFADTRRHVRLLPLSWLTWDSRTDDKIYAFPLPLPFVWYKAQELEYFVLFPFYGKQRDHESFRQSFLLFMFLREYDAETKMREYSIIWPLSNFYSSPSKSGGRIIPFFWHKREKKLDSITNRTLTPLFYRFVKHYYANTPRERKKAGLSPG